MTKREEKGRRMCPMCKPNGSRMVRLSRHPVTPPHAEPLPAPADATCAALHRRVRDGEGRENKRVKHWRTREEIRKWEK
jgi:hypothetical protein